MGLAWSGTIYGQYHFQGLKGVTLEYGIAGPWDQYYSLGVQKLLSRRFHVEVLAGYQEGAFLAFDSYQHYDIQTCYQVERFALNETINYSFLHLFKCLYLNIGVGLSQGYERSRSVIDQHVTEVEERLEDGTEPEAFDPDAITLDDRFRVGGHANGLAELYLHRYVTLVARHRFTYWLRSHFDQADHQTSVGVRINF